MKQEQPDNEIEKYSSSITERLGELITAKDKLDILDGIEYDTARLRRHLMDSNRGYFIAILDIGPDDSFVRKYVLLDCSTETQAARAIKELTDDPTGECSDNGYRKVSKEEYDNFNTLRELINLRVSMNRTIRMSRELQTYSYLETVLPFVEKDIEHLRAELGLTRSWQTVAEDIYHPSSDE